MVTHVPLSEAYSPFYTFLLYNVFYRLPQLRKTNLCFHGQLEMYSLSFLSNWGGRMGINL